MDLYKAIRELVDEKKRIDRIIASLEAMLKKGTIVTQGKTATKIAGTSRRGRKSMSAEERRQVSERMAQYWAAKRGGKSGDAPASPESQPNTDTP